MGDLVAHMKKEKKCKCAFLLAIAGLGHRKPLDLCATIIKLIKRIPSQVIKDAIKGAKITRLADGLLLAEEFSKKSYFEESVLMYLNVCSSPDCSLSQSQFETLLSMAESVGKLYDTQQGLLSNMKNANSLNEITNVIAAQGDYSLALDFAVQRLKHFNQSLSDDCKKQLDTIIKLALELPKEEIEKKLVDTCKYVNSADRKTIFIYLTYMF